MNRRAIILTSLLALAGCKMSDSLKPRAAARSAPSFSISDGAHLSGNPDFFFLPPMVPAPSKKLDKDAFNGKLNPIVDICQLNATTEAQVTPGTQCKAGGFFVSIQLTPHDVVSGDHQDGENDGENSKEPHYHTTWKVPDSDAKFFRVLVRVGFKQLGFADIERGDHEGELKDVNTGQFVHLQDESLSINFEIERFALCTPPGKGPCSSEVVDLSKGGTVTIALPNSTGPSGITIPPQGPGGPPVNITVETCQNFNPRAIDLPTFGSCLKITADPPLPEGGFTHNPATTFICDLNVPFGEGGVVISHNQEHRITLHQLDVVGEGQTVVKARPHASGCPVGGVPATSFGDFFRSLAHGQWKAAGKQVAGLLGPKTLYAYRFLDQGGGGLVDGLSDFQFALPAKMLKVAGDNQTAQPGTTLPVDPTVQVTDLGNEPVRGARVTFTTSDGSVAPGVFVTGIDGNAHAAWTIRGTAGPNSLKASGRGIGGSDFNGPREGIDPFQPIQPFFDPEATASGAILLQTGSQTFSATGSAPEPVSEGFFPFGSGGYSSKVVASTDPSPAGWTTLGFDAFANGFTIGTSSAFGSPFPGPGGCGNTTKTNWPINTDLLVRKKFTLPSAQQVQVRIAIDNDLIEVRLNGLLLTDGTVKHDGCAAPNATDNAIFIGSGAAGINILTVRALDRGGESFLDITTAAAPPPSLGNHH
jgi:hypothetical protein